MLMTGRVFCGALGLAVLAGTVVLGLNLLAMEPDRRVILAGYAGIGGILLGVYLLFYAFTGEWRPHRR
jgi:hypothetical protein